MYIHIHMLVRVLCVCMLRSVYIYVYVYVRMRVQMRERRCMHVCVCLLVCDACTLEKTRVRPCTPSDALAIVAAPCVLRPLCQRRLRHALVTLVVLYLRAVACVLFCRKI